MKTIGEKAAKEFMRDLRGTVYGDCNKANQGVMSTGLIADHMRMSVSETQKFLDMCIKYGITERQGGLYVV